MSDTVKVIIQAEATVKFKKTVQMEKADYDKYLQICAEWSSAREVEEQIKEIAFKYNFDGGGDDIEDIGEPEDIEFELVK
ncbi:hypothetical protein FHA84_22650 [Salmonella enterica subsp. enterica]|uniref:Uncharacterized protein n=1 Tax=Salmonella enterica TaxID=28901 RepID=A0A379SD11_SALER|nr:hypothetical protein [Salmonella enterica]EAA7373004.1 hypothetical protein [Salmonella enterica subsp. enterica serovar Mikawasima]EAS0615006.1 hypothetical protein [Salmonella enterica subsp. enterica serovar Dahomey]EBA1164477.1 hypothetical protein [Salmonella enterica subsp. enterica]EBF8622385.1 hypothetical protein [Salmonella enterica subsp. enterica serovar Istanbul]EBQ9005184.1 hypothetical protein [Salmonella enterica subsp. enterica serovar Blockley]EBQ9987929.1 hypothetical pr